MSNEADKTSLKTALEEPTALAAVFGLQKHPLTQRKGCVLIASLILFTIGLVMGGPKTPSPAPSNSSASGVAFGNAFTQSPPSTSGSRDPIEETPIEETGFHLRDWAPFLTKGGFGMFVGFAIGFAVRAFLRLALIMAGIQFLALAGMSYLGWVVVDWQAMGQDFTELTRHLPEQLASFKAFLNGAIPATGFTLTGLTMGLRKG